MKKVSFFAATLLIACSAFAGQFQKNADTGMYLYTGAAVNEVNVDFATWQGSDLYDEAVGTNYTTATFSLQFLEKNNLGFQRWIIYPNRWIASGVPNQNALFNNGKGNNTISVASERAFIYFPAINGGVKSVKLTGVIGWVTPWYYKASTSSWVSQASVNCNTTYGEYEFVFNDPSITMVALSYNGTAYATITKLKVSSILEQPETTDSTYVKDPATGMYMYKGAPVDNLVLDFANWTSDSLYDAAVGSNYVTNPHTLSMTVRGKVGFQKWVIYPNRWIASGVPNQNALFNNGKGNDTAAVANRPFIYFPAVIGGVKEIKVTGVMGWVIPWYYDKSTSTWKDMPSVNCGTALAETTIDLSSKKATLVALSTVSKTYTTCTKIKVVSMNDTPSEQYVKNASSGMFDYVGTPVGEKTVIDFTQMPSSKIAYNTILGKDIHAEVLLDYNNVGLYKYSYCNATRTDITYPGGSSYTTSAYAVNYQYSDCGGVSKKNDALTDVKDQPAIYLPTVVEGIDSIIVEGWSVGASNKMDVLVKGNNGTWAKPASPMPNAVIMGNKVFTKDTLVFHSREVKDICMPRTTTSFMELTKITIVPMPEPIKIAISESTDNSSVLAAYDGKEVDTLVVSRTLRGNMYNTFCLPCQVTVEKLSELMGTTCEALYFSDAVLSGNQLSLEFETITTIQAGKPYLLKPQDDVTEPFTLLNVTIGKMTSKVAKPLQSPLAAFEVSFSPKQLAASQKTLLLSTDNTLYYADKTVNMPGLRGWFELYENTPSGVNARMIVRNSPTQLDQIEMEGSKIEKYMENGNLIVIRDGVKYNVVGQKIGK